MYCHCSSLSDFFTKSEVDRICPKQVRTYAKPHNKYVFAFIFQHIFFSLKDYHMKNKITFLKDKIRN